jgi:hypothetical protein
MVKSAALTAFGVPPGIQSQTVSSIPPVNCGVYIFSVRIFEEFGLSSK